MPIETINEVYSVKRIMVLAGALLADLISPGETI